MDKISTAKQNIYKEQEYNNHMREMRMIKKRQKKDLESEKKLYKTQMNRIKENYTKSAEELNNSLQRKLIKLRTQHDRFYKTEQKRLEIQIQLEMSSQREKLGIS